VAINNLSKVTSLASSDLLAVFSSSSGVDSGVTLATLLSWLQTQLSASGKYMTQYAAPAATGFSVTVAPAATGTSVYLLMTPGASYAAGTILLPAKSSCVDQQEVMVSSTQAITTLTVSGNGATVNGAPSTLATNGFFKLRYDGVFGAWYRVG